MGLAAEVFETTRPDNCNSVVMAGLVPAIHAVRPPEAMGAGRKPRRVDGRDKPGHDGEGGSIRQ